MSKKISDLRNLGPESQKDLEAVGITTVSALKKLGPYKAFDKILEGRMKRGKSVSCCNALYLYSLYGAINDLDWREIPDEKKAEFKSYTKSLRSKA